MTRNLLSLLGLVILAGTSTAGPLRWGYRAESLDGQVLREVTGITEAGYADMILLDPQLYGTYIGDVSSGPNVSLMIWRSEVNLVLTDELANRSTSLGFWLDFVRRAEYTPDGMLNDVTEQLYSYPWVDPAVRYAGGNQFVVRNLGGEMLVSVSAVTPEPATLAMAGMGLVSFAGLRLRTTRRHRLRLRRSTS